MIEFGNFVHGVIIAKAMHAVFNSESEQVISRSEDGKLYGGTIFSDYTGTSVCMHVAGFRPHWCTRGLIAVTFRYVFIQLKCKVAIGRVSSHNKEALKFDMHLGFEPVAVIKDAVPDGDVHILQMRRENCRWLDMKVKNLQVWNHARADRNSAA